MTRWIEWSLAWLRAQAEAARWAAGRSHAEVKAWTVKVAAKARTASSARPKGPRKSRSPAGLRIAVAALSRRLRGHGARWSRSARAVLVAASDKATRRLRSTSPPSGSKPKVMTRPVVPVRRRGDAASRMRSAVGAVALAVRRRSSATAGAVRGLARRRSPRSQPQSPGPRGRARAWAPAALGGAALGGVLLVFALAIWRISAQTGLIDDPSQVHVAPAPVPAAADVVAPSAAVEPAPAEEPGPAFDKGWLREPFARPTRFMRRLEATPAQLCGRLRQLGLPEAPVTPGPLPTSPGWYCLAYQALGDSGSSLIVTLRGGRPTAVDVVRLKLNVLKPGDDREVTRTATDAVEGLHATFGWRAPQRVLRAIAQKTSLRLEEHGARYELLREEGAEVRLNVLMTFYDDGAILDPARFVPAPPWR
ncbi:DUF6030 family protein [Methylopila sp. Yamaguchi]|uniref:DUF6030 family protein n=1 Tax=Methylopila sp. Yamaguchi TaxID=1437817 RepID=UPI000CC33208|nr:DUF6030 family protein [Methylopila sp. Yamaguchi]GBD48689.1 hypothetical protein METY_1902 [Methylopila sp. Yamaguchi]